MRSIFKRMIAIVLVLGALAVVAPPSYGWWYGGWGGGWYRPWGGWGYPYGGWGPGWGGWWLPFNIHIRL